MKALIALCETHLESQRTVLYGAYFDLVEGGLRAPAEWLAGEVAAVIKLVKTEQ